MILGTATLAESSILLKWTRRACGNDATSFPATLVHVVAYLMDLAVGGTRVSTVKLARAPIAACHWDAGYPNPAWPQGVRRVVIEILRIAHLPYRPFLSLSRRTRSARCGSSRAGRRESGSLLVSQQSPSDGRWLVGPSHRPTEQPLRPDRLPVRLSGRGLESAARQRRYSELDGSSTSTPAEKEKGGLLP